MKQCPSISNRFPHSCTHCSPLHPFCWLLIPGKGRVVTGQAEQLRRPCPPRLPPAHSGDPQAIPGQPGDIVIPPACARAAPGSPPGRTCLEHLQREAPGGHSYQVPTPPQLTPLNPEENAASLLGPPSCEPFPSCYSNLHQHTCKSWMSFRALQ